MIDSTDTCAHDPSVCSHEIDTITDKFLLLCSDDVWEFMDSKEAVPWPLKLTQGPLKGICGQIRGAGPNRPEGNKNNK